MRPSGFVRVWQVASPTKVARIRAADYLAHPELFTRENTPVDFLISPEKLVTDHVQRLIEYPGALQVLDFADGRAQLVATRAVREGKLIVRADQLPQQQRHRQLALHQLRTGSCYATCGKLARAGKLPAQDGDLRVRA